MTNKQRYRYPLQLPAFLKETAMRYAREDGVSLNQWIVAAVAQKIGAVATAKAFLQKRAAQAVEFHTEESSYYFIKRLIGKQEYPVFLSNRIYNFTRFSFGHQCGADQNIRIKDDTRPLDI